jgi:hypothetical protein
MRFLRLSGILFISILLLGMFFATAPDVQALDECFSDIEFTGTDAVVIRYKGNVKIQEKSNSDWTFPEVGMRLWAVELKLKQMRQLLI